MSEFLTFSHTQSPSTPGYFIPVLPRTDSAGLLWTYQPKARAALDQALHPPALVLTTGLGCPGQFPWNRAGLRYLQGHRLETLLPIAMLLREKCSIAPEATPLIRSFMYSLHILCIYTYIRPIYTYEQAGVVGGDPAHNRGLGIR